MPLRFLRGSTSRLALSVIALACGVALVCAIDLVNRAVLRAFTEVVDTMAGGAALQVTAGGNSLLPEEVAEKVAAVPGVELAVPVVSATAFTTDESGDLLTVHGVEVTNERAVRVYEARDAGGLEIDDPLEFLNQADSVVLTRAFAARKGLEVGDPIELETPTGRRTFTIRGLLEPRGIARVYGGNLVVMDLFAAEAAFTRPGFVNRVDVVLQREAAVAPIQEEIARAVPGLTVEAPAQRKADLNALMASQDVMLKGLSVVGLIAAFLIAFNRLSAVFEARVWQLAMLEAVGVRQRAVRREMLKEALLLGAAGVGLGLPLGLILGRLLLPIIATTTALNYRLVAPEAELGISPASLALGIAMGLGASLLAAWLPARRAARLRVAEALTGRGREQPGMSAARAWIVVALMGAAIGSAVALQAATRSPLWGLVATALIAVAGACAARPLSALLHAPLAWCLRAVGGATGGLAARSLAENPRRVSLTVATVGVGLGAVLWLRIVNASFQASVVDQPAFTADLYVSSTNVASGFVEAPLADGILDELRAVEGVERVAGERILDWTHDGVAVALDAFDPDYFLNPKLGQWPLLGRHAADTWQALAGGHAALVSSNLLLRHGDGIRDGIVLQTPKGPLELDVAGVTIAYYSPGGTIPLSRDLLKQYWGDSQINHALIQVAPGRDPVEVRAAIAKRLGRKYGLKIFSAAELGTYWREQVGRAFAPFDALAALVLLVILLGVSDTLAASVVDRTRELGMLRAVGVRRPHLRRLMVLEALSVGSLGLLLAFALGGSLGLLWVEGTFPYLLGWLFRLQVPHEQGIALLLVTLAVCLLAALGPANRAANLEAAEALRYE